MKKLLFLLLTSYFSLLTSHMAFASHLAGGQITYTHGVGLTYTVTYTFYRDCGGVGAPANVTINTTSANAGVNFNTVSGAGVNNGNVVPVCATATTTCSGGATPGRAKWVYTAAINLPSQQTDWTFAVTENARNAGITTSNASGQNMYVYATLNNTISPGNNAPVFANDPAAFIYINQPFCFNNGAVDVDGDSLAYSLVNPLIAAGSPITWNFPYSATQPVASTPPVTFNTATGDVCMTPTLIEVTVIAILVREYRWGQLIGSVERDIQVMILPGADALPALNGINGTGTYIDTAIVGCAYTFTTSATDANAAQCVTMTSTVATAIPLASFVVANGCPGLVRPTGTFNWTPLPADATNYPKYFTVTVRDNFCNINGQQVKAYGIQVINLNANFTSTAPSCVGQNVNFYAEWVVSNYGYLWDFGAGSVATFAMATSPNPAGVYYTTAGAKTVNLTITTPGGCVVTNSQIITVNPSPTASFTSSATTLCSGSTVNFTNTGTTGAGVTYSWNFGAGASPATSTAENASGIIYSTAGTKTVTHTVTNNFGCVTTLTNTITINQTPTASFSSTAPSCTGSNVNFTNTGTSAGVTWFWNFGAGAVPPTSVLQNPTNIVYSTAGTKSVTLTTTSSTSTCSATAAQTININQTPAPAYTSTAPQCTGNAVTFTYTGTTGVGWVYAWDFGTGATPATSSAQNPGSVIYSTAGTKTITITVINNGLCAQTITGTITINQTPTASFSSTAPACTGSNVDFTNTGTSAGVTWFWNFGAGAVPPTSVLQNPTNIVYSTAGTKSVTLTTTSSTSTCSATAAQTININQTPAPAYTSTAPQCQGGTVTFNYTGTTGIGWTYNWDFGTGATPALSSAQNPGSVIYSTAGTKTITITVTNNGLCAQTITGTITIDPTPIANFSSTAPSCTGLPVIFTNTGDTIGVTYAWTFGSGANPVTSTSQDTTVVYSTSGPQTVTLISTIGNCTDTSTQIITINQTPAPSFSSNAPQCVGTAINFTYTGTTGTGWNYAWDFGTGATPALSSAQNPPSVMYSTSGTKTITLTVDNNGTCVSTYTTTILISATPVANFSSTAPQCTGLPVDFTNTGTVVGVIWSWTFGSGATPATSTLQSPTGITYSVSGTKVITLTTTNLTTLCTNTYSTTININQSPTSSFVSNAPQCASTGVNFTNTGSTGLGWTFFWDFGVGASPQTSIAENPSGVLYATAGTKTVTLTISDANCSATSTQTITVNASPVASFTSNAPMCTGDSVNFQNTGTSGATYAWDFGSGSAPATSTTQNQMGVIYSTSGIKTVTLITTLGTCTDTSMQTILINQTPSVSFTSTTPQCVGNSVNFSNTGSTGGNWTFSWSFGAGATPASSSSENPNGIIYATAGTKTVTLTISDGTCSNTLTQTISINALPVADAGADTVICNFTSVQIGSAAVAGNTYAWFPSSTLNNAAIADPIASPVAPSTNYIVTVTETSTGCVATDSVVVDMLAPLDANAGVDVEICRYDSIQIGAALITGQTYTWTPTEGLNNTTKPNPVCSPSVTTTYTLSVTGPGCGPVTDEVTVTVHPLPIVDAGPNDTITIGSSTQLTATGGMQYTWTPATGLSNVSIYNPIANPTITTTYYVTATDVFGCVNTDSVIIYVIEPTFWVPTAFTPNADGQNDILFAHGDGINNFELGVYNRWGELVWSTKDIKAGWDGKRQIGGQELPEGAYVYYVKGDLSNGDVIDKSGLINLIR